jgi:hypothetical protein
VDPRRASVAWDRTRRAIRSTSDTAVASSRRTESGLAGGVMAGGRRRVDVA